MERKKLWTWNENAISHWIVIFLSTKKGNCAPRSELCKKWTWHFALANIAIWFFFNWYQSHGLTCKVIKYFIKKKLCNLHQNPNAFSCDMSISLKCSTEDVERTKGSHSIQLVNFNSPLPRNWFVSKYYDVIDTYKKITMRVVVEWMKAFL